MTRVFCSVAMAILPTVSQAGFEVIDAPAETVSRAPQSASSTATPRAGAKVGATAPGGFEFMALNQIGTPDRSVPVVTGFGRDLKLVEAIRQIAPAGWQTYIKEELASSQPRSVGWKGGRRWLEVLDILATDHNLSIDVDWSRRALFVGHRKAAQASARASQAWEAKTGGTLRESVAEWAKRAGWQLVWSAPIDYPIAAQLTFEGAFLDAVTSVFRSYEKAERPLLVDVHEGQKVIVVSLRK